MTFKYEVDDVVSMKTERTGSHSDFVITDRYYASSLDLNVYAVLSNGLVAAVTENLLESGVYGDEVDWCGTPEKETPA